MQPAASELSTPNAGCQECLNSEFFASAFSWKFAREICGDRSRQNRKPEKIWQSSRPVRVQISPLLQMLPSSFASIRPTACNPLVEATVFGKALTQKMGEGHAHRDDFVTTTDWIVEGEL
jgi:hypothetical protein